MSEFTNFQALELPEQILRAISEMGFSTPTPIQQQAIPVLANGQNVLGEAQTGTGKTAAFGLPALARINSAQRQAQMLVVAPTRELALQVAASIEEMGRYMKGLTVATIYGGAPYGQQIRQLKGGAQVVVGTPGRLMDHLRKGTLDASGLQLAVLDEADEMLNMGFIDDIEWIMEQVPEQAQRALFSATMPPAIKKIANRFLSDSVHVKVQATAANKADIAQQAWRVQGMTKETALERLLEVTDYELALVFVRTRQDTLTIAAQLREQGFQAAPLNGDMSQDQREATVSQLKKGQVRVLVATDVVARGLDVPGISHVINYDLPQDAESYVHRIGRTGRAGRSGEAILFVRPREMHLLKRYEKATKGRITTIELPRGRELSQFRIQAAGKNFQQQLAENPQMEDMASLLNQIKENTGLDDEQLATALLYEFQRQRPLIVKDKPLPKRQPQAERDNRGRKPRQERSAAKPRRKERAASVPMTRYRMSVGKAQGIRPGDIVGAIANEIDLDSKFIGQIELHQQHATVELPEGMPVELLRKLKSTRVRQQPMQLQPDS